jgi:hypothetical protein
MKKHMVLFVVAVALAIFGVFIGSDFYLWMLHYGIDAGTPHVVFVILTTGFIFYVTNEVRHTYLERSPYHRGLFERRVFVFMVDVVFLAFLFGSIIAPMVSLVHRGKGMTLASILFIAIFIAFLTCGASLAVDIERAFRRRRGQ